MGGSIFSAGSLLGDSPITGQDSSLYTTPVFDSPGNDASQYTDAGQDPTSGSGGNFLSTLDSVVNDAFKAYTVASTPTSYRAAQPGSPAAIQSQAQATALKSSQQNSQILLIGGILVVIVVLFLLFKK